MTRPALGLARDRVEIWGYDPRWPALFAEERERLLRALAPVRTHLLHACIADGAHWREKVAFRDHTARASRRRRTLRRAQARACEPVRPAARHVYGREERLRPRDSGLV
jgi:GrpB-like predicted nucleotidyltransferase (UPF0157 family)